MNKITLHKNRLNNVFLSKNLILILVLAMLTSTLCGCSMILGEEAPIDKERITQTDYGLSYEIPKDYTKGNIRLSNGTITSAWTNDPNDVKFYFALATADANQIDLKTFNWISTGYFTGKITYMGQTLTLDPKFINPSVEETEEITINGYKGYRTKIVYDYQETADKLTNTTEVVYILQIDNTLVYMVFSVRTADYKDYSDLIEAIADSIKKA